MYIDIRIVYQVLSSVFRFRKDLVSISWEKMLDSKDFPNIVKVIDLILTLPSTSVKCETAFSQLKLLKTCRRSSLTSDVLNNLMAVKLLAPPIQEFNPADSIETWLVSLTIHQELTYSIKVTSITEQKPIS